MHACVEKGIKYIPVQSEPHFCMWLWFDCPELCSRGCKVQQEIDYLHVKEEKRTLCVNFVVVLQLSTIAIFHAKEKC